jgi:hypothetical protein
MTVAVKSDKICDFSFQFSTEIMNKTIRSDVRRVLFTMLSKYTQKQEEHETLFNQKMGCLQVVTSFIG